MKFKTIFVAGVHGVGKSTLSEKISGEFEFPHYHASTLIKQIKNSDIDNDKIVIDAESNQDHLIIALENININAEYIILDGHFCLQGDGNIIDVSLDTFKNMNLASVVLLCDEPVEIQKRMCSRDIKSFDLEEIELLQERERERAEFVTNRLNAPIFQGNIYHPEKIIAWLKNKPCNKPGRP